MAKKATVIGTAANPQSGMARTAATTPAQNKAIRAAQRKAGVKVMGKQGGGSE